MRNLRSSAAAPLLPDEFVCPYEESEEESVKYIYWAYNVVIH